jgi:hypothetical protein
LEDKPNHKREKKNKPKEKRRKRVSTANLFDLGPNQTGAKARNQRLLA